MKNERVFKLVKFQDLRLGEVCYLAKDGDLEMWVVSRIYGVADGKAGLSRGPFTCCEAEILTELWVEVKK